MNKVQIVRRTALILGIIFALTVIVSRVIQWNDVTAVQNSLYRKYEINFNDNVRPKYLPKFADELVERWLQKRYEETIGSVNLDIIYHERFRSLFRGPLRSLEIYNSVAFNERLPIVISGLGQLERFTLCDPDGNSSEEGWRAVVESVARLPKLAELELSGTYLTSSALQGLDQASKLKKLTIGGPLDGTCLDGLVNLKDLRELHVHSIELSGDEYGFSHASLAVFLPTLVRFDRLEALSFATDQATTRQWGDILRSLAKFPMLRELNIEGKGLTNEILSALAGAPRLEALSVYGTVDAGCAPSLETLPALKRLAISDMRNGGHRGLPEESLKTLRDALPSVSVNAR